MTPTTPTSCRSLGPGRLEVGLAAGDHHEHPVAGQHVVDELDRALLADRQRRQRVGERHGLAQRQHRQRRGQRPGGRPISTSRGSPAVGGDVDHGPARRSAGRPASGLVRERSIGTRARLRLGLGERQLDPQDAVAGRWPWPARRRRRRRAGSRGGTGRARSRAAGRRGPRRRPARRWPASVSSRPSISSPSSSGSMPGELGVDDRPRAGRRRRRRRPRARSRCAASVRPARPKTSPKSSSISRRMRSKLANRSRSGAMGAIVPRRRGALRPVDGALAGHLDGPAERALAPRPAPTSRPARRRCGSARGGRRARARRARRPRAGVRCPRGPVALGARQRRLDHQQVGVVGEARRARRSGCGRRRR